MSPVSLHQLPSELTDKIADHLAPLSRASLLRALTWRTSLSTKNHSYARIWDFIFKNDSWMREVLLLKNEHGGAPLPCLVGSQLRKVYYGKPKGVYLTLLVNDWTGDVLYLRKRFFDSLRDYEVVDDNSIIRLKASGILLHIAEAVGQYWKEDNWIPMMDPSKLFRQKGSRLSTQVVYYTENMIYEIDHTKIGGIEGRSTKKAKAVRDICSIRLKFRDGSPVYPVFISPKKTVRVKNIQTRDENGRHWVTHWRVAGQYEREWWQFGEGLGR